jgi:hypothetical protein
MPRWYSWVNTSIIERIVTRFTLQDTPIELLKDWILNKTIQPITNIDELLLTTEIDASVYTDGGVGNKAFVTVPAGERWTVRACHIIRATGDRTISALYLNDGTNAAKIKTFAAATSEHISDLYTPPLKLAEGWSLVFTVDVGGGNDGTWNCRIYCDKELAY